MIERDALRKGTKYKVYFEDCCIAGEFIGTFVAYRNFDDEECEYQDDNFNSFAFDIGSVGYSYGGITFEEIEDAATSTD